MIQQGLEENEAQEVLEVAKTHPATKMVDFSKSLANYPATFETMLQMSISAIAGQYIMGNGASSEELEYQGKF